MALRGAGHATAGSSSSTSTTWASSGAKVSPTPTPATAAPRWPKNLPQALAIYADVLRRPHLPDDQLEAGRLAMLQELRAVEDEPAQKVMIELRRRHYPEPWGRLGQGEQEALEAIDDRRHPRLLPPLLSPQRHDPRRGRPLRLGPR